MVPDGKVITFTFFHQNLFVRRDARVSYLDLSFRMFIVSYTTVSLFSLGKAVVEATNTMCFAQEQHVNYNGGIVSPS